MRFILRLLYVRYLNKSFEGGWRIWVEIFWNVMRIRMFFKIVVMEIVILNVDIIINWYLFKGVLYLI